MKGYKRLTERENDCVKYAKSLTSNYIGAIYEEQKEREKNSRNDKEEQKQENAEKELEEEFYNLARELKEDDK